MAMALVADTSAVGAVNRHLGLVAWLRLFHTPVPTHPVELNCSVCYDYYATKKYKPNISNLEKPGNLSCQKHLKNFMLHYSKTYSKPTSKNNWTWKPMPLPPAEHMQNMANQNLPWPTSCSSTSPITKNIN